jgi:general secretion pathway protein F
MAIYSYKGITKQGKEIKSTVVSDSKQIAKNKLRANGIMLLNIEEQKSSKKNPLLNISLGSSITINDLSMMTRQLATLLKAKIQIVESLKALMDQVDNEHLRIILSEVKQKVSEGKSLANSLGDYPKVFNNVFINMVEAGEASGTLDIVLVRLAEFSESQVRLKNKIQGAMLYPIVMGCFGVIAMGIIFAFVIPKITKVFLSMKMELPAATKLSIFLSNAVQNYWWLIIIIFCLFIYSINKYIKTPGGIKKWHKIQLKLPLIGNLIKMVNISRFCSTLGTLLNSGVPILSSLSIVSNMISNMYIKEAINNSKISVSEGQSLSGPLIKSGYFPSMVTHMIALGEKSGELEPMLGIIAENYEEQVDTKLSSLTTLIEPIMIIMLGCFVAFIIASVILPLMKMNSLK